MYKLDGAVEELNIILKRRFALSSNLKLSWGNDNEEDYLDDPLRMVNIKKGKIIIRNLEEMYKENNLIWYLHLLRGLILDCLLLDTSKEGSWSISTLLALLIRSEYESTQLNNSHIEGLEKIWRSNEEFSKGITNTHLFYNLLKNRRKKENLQYADGLVGIIIKERNDPLHLIHYQFHQEFTTSNIKLISIEFIKVVLKYQIFKNKEIKKKMLSDSTDSKFKIAESTVAKIKSDLGIILLELIYPNFTYLNIANLYFYVPASEVRHGFWKNIQNKNYIYLQNIWPVEKDQQEYYFNNYIIPLTKLYTLFDQRYRITRNIEFFLLLPDSGTTYYSFPYSKANKTWISAFSYEDDPIIIDSEPDIVSDDDILDINLTKDNVQILNEILSQQKNPPSHYLTNYNQSQIRKACNSIKYRNYLKKKYVLNSQFEFTTQLIIIPTSEFIPISNEEVDGLKKAPISSLQHLILNHEELLNKDKLEYILSKNFPRIYIEQLLEIKLKINQYYFRRISLIEVLCSKEDAEVLLTVVGTKYHYGSYKADTGIFQRFPYENIENGNWNFDYSHIFTHIHSYIKQ